MSPLSSSPPGGVVPPPVEPPPEPPTARRRTAAARRDGARAAAWTGAAFRRCAAAGGSALRRVARWCRGVAAAGLSAADVVQLGAVFYGEQQHQQVVRLEVSQAVANLLRHAVVVRVLASRW